LRTVPNTLEVAMKRNWYFFIPVVALIIMSLVQPIPLAAGDVLGNAFATLCGFSPTETVTDYTGNPSGGAADDWTYGNCAITWQKSGLGSGMFWSPVGQQPLPAGSNNSGAQNMCAEGEINMLGESTFDGDLHVNLDPYHDVDSNSLNSVTALMNQQNWNGQDPITGKSIPPTMVVEIPLTDRGTLSGNSIVHTPSNSAFIAPDGHNILKDLRGHMLIHVCGQWVTDTAPFEGWNELHPVTSLDVYGTPFNMTCDRNTFSPNPGQPQTANCSITSYPSSSPVSLSCLGLSGYICTFYSASDFYQTSPISSVDRSASAQQDQNTVLIEKFTMAVSSSSTNVGTGVIYASLQGSGADSSSNYFSFQVQPVQFPDIQIQHSLSACFPLHRLGVALSPIYGPMPVSHFPSTTCIPIKNNFSAGDRVTDTVTITNNGWADASYVELQIAFNGDSNEGLECSPYVPGFVSQPDERVSPNDGGTYPSQGYCAGNECYLGSIPSGSSATVASVDLIPSFPGNMTITAFESAYVIPTNPNNSQPSDSPIKIVIKGNEPGYDYAYCSKHG
jgi:hypothetical protein